MKIPFFTSITFLTITSSFLSAGSCSNGFCVASTPLIPSDIENNIQTNKFKDGYNGWVLIDNAGDTIIGEYRIMGNVDVNSLLADNDKFSFFGLLTDESLNSGKVSYKYPLINNDLYFKTSYIHTNYTLDNRFNSDGIGTLSLFRGEFIYSIMDDRDKKLSLSLS